MSLVLYNTLTKKEEVFTPQKEGKVTMYTCGPTVYSRPHIGNYASFLMADLLRRWLEVSGYEVKHVKNITDVGHLVHDADQGEDKIQKEAEKEKVDPLEIAKRYEEMYLEDERALNFLEPADRPRATDYIADMLGLTRDLVARGNAYELDDGYYFDVRSFEAYGALSGNNVDDLCAGSRVAVDSQKKCPADFALWKKCVGGNASHVLRWSTETGERVDSVGEDPTAGFPGWHIECSAMASSLLGKQIDIHTGGEDNIFPHHECEIAQSECGFGVSPFVKLWLHRRRIDLQGEKMSKSLGNVLSIPDIEEKGFSPLDVRYLFLSVHYRTNLKFSWDGLTAANKARKKIAEWVSRKGAGEQTAGKSSSSLTAKDVQKHIDTFADCMNADLNVSGALAAVFDCIHAANKNAPDRAAEKLLKEFTATVERTFGCFELEELSIPPEVQSLLDEREKARQDKDFTASDRLRDEILQHGFVVKDTSDGQSVKQA